MSEQAEVEVPEPDEVEVGKSTRFRRERSRRRLREMLRRTPDDPFLRMIWAVDLLQNSEPAVARRFLEAPDAAVGTKLGDKMFSYKWLLEDLVNELLITPKLAHREGPNWLLDCGKYEAFRQAYNVLYELQDAEHSLTLDGSSNIWAEMPRIGHRQFSWQQPALNLPNFYRSAALYGEGALSRHFEAQHGLTPSDLMLLGMGLWALLGSQPSFGRNLALPEIGLSQEVVDRGLKLLAAPIKDARQAALELRGFGRDRIYRPSALRRFPCISFGPGAERTVAPLRELILVRATEGLYYDLVGISDDVRRELGKSFELYAHRFVQAVLETPVHQAIQYRLRNNLIDSPDILIGPAEGLGVIVECKATRMSFDARFAQDRQPAAARGVEELSKGVGQIWRFASHVRRGLVPGYGLQNEVFGLVLTVDPWLRMTVGEADAIFERARQWCAARDPEIEPQDQMKVGFTHLEDFERMALQTDEAGIVATCKFGSDPAYIGWGFSELRQRAGAAERRRKYPFQSDMGRLLPWWTKIDEEQKARAARVS